MVKPIGNCFFRVLSDIIYSSQGHHNLVRTQIVEHIAQNPTQFAPLLIQKISIDEHLDQGEPLTIICLNSPTENSTMPIRLSGK